MGKVIPRSASIDRIHEAASKALAIALARGGEIQALAEARIAPVITALGDNEQKLNQSRAEDDALHATLMARDNDSDLEIGAVCDEIWNTMGRPSQSIDYDIIVSGGKNVWTDGDPAKQPSLMGVLAANIRNSKHPKLADKKESWAKRIEVKAAAQAEAARPAEVSHARVTTLAMQRRTLADAVQLALTRFKRDLKNLGMTEAQVHEIIPDAPSAANGQKPVPPAPNPAPAS
jgi:hypothetical protein